MANGIGDCSLRFYNYVCSLSKSIDGYLPANMKEVKTADLITYSCISIKKYDDGNVRKLKAPTEDEIKKIHDNKLPKRILMPKDWKISYNTKLLKLLNDKSIKFIVFPILCIRKAVVCKLSKNLKKHMLLMVYNKNTKQMELWDDLHFGTHSEFSTKNLYKMQNYTDLFLLKILEREFNFVFKSKSIYVPHPLESVHNKIRNELKSASINNDYNTCYSAYLTDYIERRIKKPNVNFDIIKNQINYSNLSKSYINLIEYNNKWKEHNMCDDPMKIVNKETGLCINAKSKTAKIILGITDICIFPKVQNATTGACKKIRTDVDIQQHYIDLENSKESYLTRHVQWEHHREIMEYYLRKFPFLSTSNDNEFDWETPINQKKWKLTPPKTFKKQMKNSMSNSKIRFIVFYINLRQDDHSDYHANTLIIDKNARTIERFEPNDSSKEWEDFNNGEELDNELRKVFNNYNLTYIPMNQTCPIGFQQLEGREDSSGFKSFGGNCIMWALWYMDLRLSNPDVPRDILIKSAWKKIKNDGSFKVFINSYHHFLSKQIRKKK